VKRDAKAWRRLQTHAMGTDVSWRRPAQQYAALFRDVVRQRAAA
jgi:starch synthase